jgi:hypothetical protein
MGVILRFEGSAGYPVDVAADAFGGSVTIAARTQDEGGGDQMH